MADSGKISTEIRRLPGGFRAVSAGGVIVDAASPSEEAARAKLERFLKDMRKEKQ